MISGAILSTIRTLQVVEFDVMLLTKSIEPMNVALEVVIAESPGELARFGDEMRGLEARCIAALSVFLDVLQEELFDLLVLGPEYFNTFREARLTHLVIIVYFVFKSQPTGYCRSANVQSGTQIADFHLFSFDCFQSLLVLDF